MNFNSRDASHARVAESALPTFPESPVEGMLAVIVELVDSG